VHSSGGRTRYGSITKQGSRWLRWILIELSYHFVNGSERMRRIYWRVRDRHGDNTARVAVAREMLKVIYYVLRDRSHILKVKPAVSLGSWLTLMGRALET